MSETSACFGWLIPIGQDGKDVALFPLKRQLYVIGSAEQVNIRLPYKGIHPFHATVIVDSQGCVTLRNIARSRFLVVNGKLEPDKIQLHHLDIIQLGKHTFRFEDATSTPSLAKPVQKRSAKPAAAKNRKGNARKEVERPIPNNNSISSPPSLNTSLASATESNTSVTGTPTALKEPDAIEKKASKQPTTAAILPSAVPTQELESSVVALLNARVSDPSTAPSLETSMSETEVQVVKTGEEDDDQLQFSQRAPPVLTPHSSQDDDNELLFPRETTSAPTANNASSTGEPSISEGTAIEKTKPSVNANKPRGKPSKSTTTPMETKTRSSRRPAKTTAAAARTVLADSDEESKEVHVKNNGAGRQSSSTKTRRPDSREPPQRSTRHTSIRGSNNATSSTGALDHVLSDDMFEYNNTSTMIDDEGRAPPAALDDLFRSGSDRRDSISKAKASSSKLVATKGKKTAPETRKQNSKKRTRASSRLNDAADSDVELESLAKRQRTTPAARDAVHHNMHRNYAPPLASGSSPEKQRQHIVTQLLKQHGTLTHEQVVNHCRAYPPYAKALAENPDTKNWRMDLLYALGRPSFMPHLQREGPTVFLPASSLMD